jgi:hypothetical protein
MLSPFVNGPVERAQSLQESWFGDAGNRAAKNRSAALVEISIDCAGRSHAAFGRCAEAAAYLLDLLLSHVTSAPAKQYSVLVIHTVLLSSFWVPLVGPKAIQEKSLRRIGYTSAPHSLMKVSPSAPFVAEAVQRVAVRIPPLTNSTSCSLRARAPRRSNTLFWSFMVFSPFIIGVR